MIKRKRVLTVFAVLLAVPALSGVLGVAGIRAVENESGQAIVIATKLWVSSDSEPGAAGGAAGKVS